MKDWIKMSDRKPTEADLPLWTWNTREGDVELWSVADGTPLRTEYLSHWKPAKNDVPPPPKEETQRKRDDAALDRLDKDKFFSTISPSIRCSPTSVQAWHAALAYERAEVLKLLNEIDTIYDNSAIRVRCTP